MRILVPVACMLLLSNLVAAEEFVYKFGEDVGRVIHTAEGNIPLLQYLTEIDIPVPDGSTVTYVEVTVNALSPPKVKFDELYHKVIIQYSWSQITISTYKIIVKGI